jgi:hypothetical protein
VSRFDLDLPLNVAKCCMSCVLQSKRYAGRRWSGPARALSVLIDLDCVGEHALNTFQPLDRVARSGWVGFRQQIGSYLLVGGNRSAEKLRCWGTRGGIAGLASGGRELRKMRGRPMKEDRYLTILPLRGVYLHLCSSG